MTETPKSLAAKSPAELTDWLIDAAGSLQRARIESNDAAGVELLDLVKAAAGEAEGQQVSILEVAESMLRVLVRDRVDARARATHRFLSLGPNETSRILERLLARHRMQSEQVAAQPEKIRKGLDELLEAGVLVRDGVELMMRPSAVTSVAEVFDPLAFRHWRRVETLRNKALMFGLKNDESANLFVNELSVTHDQALRFLDREPLKRASRSARRSGFRVLYQDPSVMETVPAELRGQESVRPGETDSVSQLSRGSVRSSGMAQQEPLLQ